MYLAIPWKECDVSVRKCNTTPWNGHLDKNKFRAESRLSSEEVFFNKQVQFEETIVFLEDHAACLCATFFEKDAILFH